MEKAYSVPTGNRKSRCGSVILLNLLIQEHWLFVCSIVRASRVVQSSNSKSNMLDICQPGWSLRSLIQCCCVCLVARLVTKRLLSELFLYISAVDFMLMDHFARERVVKLDVEAA